MLLLIWVDPEHASSRFRLCAEHTTWAHFAIGRVEFDMDDVFSMAVIGWDPVAAGLALWARHLLGLPVNAELARGLCRAHHGPAS